MKEIIAGAEPFFLPRGEVGCLLIHGFTGTPFEMREMGEYLGACGFSALGVRLFGHATTKEDLYRVNWQDWASTVEDGYQILSGVASQIFIIGLSMGSLLAIKFSRYNPVQGLVLISTPYYAPDPRLNTIGPFLPYIRHVYRSYAKSDSHWDDPRAGLNHIEYDGYPLRGVQEVGTILGEAVSLLPKLRIPTLLVHSLQDRSVIFDHARLVMHALGSSHKRLKVLERSAHNVPRDSERRSVFEDCASFIRQVLEGSGL
jgi:carboxylesterase